MSLATANVISGVTQSDILIKTALEAAIGDLRSNPWLLDYCFNSLQQDPLIAANTLYSAEIKRAKEWYLSTNVPVSMDYAIREMKTPLISVELVSSVEAESTLGDVNPVYGPTQLVDAVAEKIAPNPVILGPFTPVSFNSVTGLVVLPDSLANQILVPGMVLVDTRANQGYPIQMVISETEFSIQTNVVADFTNAFIAPISSFFVETIESCLYRETYNLGCHVSGEPVHLTYLYSILVFILLRYKQYLLENRGFDRTTLQAARFEMNKLTDHEVLYSRYVQITGYVRHMWPKIVAPQINGVVINGIQIIGGSATPASLLAQASVQMWDMQADPIAPLQNPGNSSQIYPGNVLNIGRV